MTDVEVTENNMITAVHQLTEHSAPGPAVLCIKREVAKAEPVMLMLRQSLEGSKPLPRQYRPVG